MTTTPTRFLKALLAALALMAGPAVSHAAGPAVSAEDLRKYNQVRLSREARVVNATDNGDIAAFRDFKFDCRKQPNYSYQESPEAKAAVERFLAYVTAHPSPSDAQKAERLSLLEAAIKAGSWRADYIDITWGIWENRGRPQDAQPYADRLGKLASQGLPIAIHSLLRWTNGQYGDRQNRLLLLKAAIERGNPNTMSDVGYNLGTHDLKLRPMAKQMLDCAAGQGHADAYDGIGQIAWHEGRWIDAYRSWVKGANLGCDDCLGKIEDLVLLRPGHDIEEGTYDVDPKLKALRAFYAGQFIYEITELTDLRIPAPAALQVTVSDASIVKLIKLRLARHGRP
jgi:hypothetical protein